MLTYTLDIVQHGRVKDIVQTNATRPSWKEIAENLVENVEVIFVSFKINVNLWEDLESLIEFTKRQ